MDDSTELFDIMWSCHAMRRLEMKEVPEELLDLAAIAAARTLGQGPMQALAEARGLRL